MPELPEVETTRAGIEPHILNKPILSVVVRQSKLRWPVPNTLSTELPGNAFSSVARRGKYLLLSCSNGTLLIHLGMSGSLRLVAEDYPVNKHDHVDIHFADKRILRYTDPRRFGCMLWEEEDIYQHPLLVNLGPEPLGLEFTDQHLYQKSRRKKAPVKSFIMDSNVVVGVGNIYANEALFNAGIHPARSAGNISLARYQRLTDCIKTVLANAINTGGTTLRDFTDSDGKPGYFKQELKVYGRAGASCKQCQAMLKEIRQGQRSSVYCPHCQR